MKLNLNIFENHKIYPIEIETSDTVDAIMRIINDKEGIPLEHQRLIFNGKMLEAGRTLADYGIEKDNTIFVNLRHKNKIVHDNQNMNGGLIIKRLFDQKPIIIERDNFDMQVDDVKRIINDRFGIPIDMQLLFFKGKLLDDGRNLSEYSIKKDDTINLAIRRVLRSESPESPESQNTRMFLESQRQ